MNFSCDEKFISAWWQERFSQEELALFSKLKSLVTKTKLRKPLTDPNLDWRDLFDLWDQQNGMCAYSGLPLSIETNHPEIVSLDRIDSSKGYTKDNLQLLAWSVNKMKQEFSEEYFLKMCSLIASKTTHKTKP